MSQATVGALPYIIAALAAATAVSFVLTPLAIRFASRVGAIDQPDMGRRVHRLPIPRAGGLAVVAAFVGIGVGAVLLNDTMRQVPILRILPDHALAALFLGTALAAVLGFLDDRFEIRARWQITFQLGLALVAVAGGVLIRNLNNPLGFLDPRAIDDIVRFSDEAAVLVTVLWVVGMINSINFVDGLDGLSTGIAVIASTTLAVLSLVQNQPSIALLCAILAGSLAGFLPWNFNPARVFIGTTGVYAVGFALAVLSILGVAKVAVAMLVLGVPIIDTFWIIIRRVAARRSPFTPDRGHFHHRLLDLGLTHRGAVLVIYGICCVLAVLSLVLTEAGSLYAFAGIVVGMGLVLQLMTRRSQEALDARSYEEPEAGQHA